MKNRQTGRTSQLVTEALRDVVEKKKRVFFITHTMDFARHVAEIHVGESIQRMGSEMREWTRTPTGWTHRDGGSLVLKSKDWYLRDGRLAHRTDECEFYFDHWCWVHSR